MADKRKLQGEIDRCLKKVAEGVETFEDIWQKVYNAANANQKEKYEADLKKEIKKLQRLRDQIKTWLTSNDIKDKRALMENRRLIETQMERFKVVERETKTKAYSKEGLGLAAKVDPAQREKEEVREWLSECIVKLQLQIDQFESEIETLHAGSKKKKLDRDKQDRVDELLEWVERHKFHVRKLETIMRMLDNCSLETDQIKEIQEDLNYYTDSNQDPDFCENEMIYDDLNLDEGPSVTNPPILPTPPSTFGTAAAEEEVSSIASSPTSGGPLSPKTPTAVKSTSQELFEERRRGKTTSVSSEQGNEVSQGAVPPSPLRPNSKPLVFNSSFTPLKPIPSTSNKVTTPMPSSASSSAPSSAPSSSSKSSQSLGSPGNNSLMNKPPFVAQQPPTTTVQKNQPPPPAKVVQPPTGPAYAVAVGNHQNSLGNLSIQLPNNSDNSGPLLPSSQLSHSDESGTLVASSTTSGDSDTNSVSVSTTSAPPLLHTTQPPSAQSRSSGPGSVQSQHSRSSSTSSSLSPNLAPSQEAQALSLQQQQQSTLVSSVTSHDSVPVSTTPQQQPAVSPAFNSQVSASSSPTGSPTNNQQVSSSPIHLAAAISIALPTPMPTAASSQTAQATSREVARIESVASAPSLATGSQVPPAVPSLGQGLLAAAAAAAAAAGGSSSSSTTPSITSATGSSLSSLSFGGLHPSVVTSFSHQLAGSTPFSPSSGGGSLSASLATVGSSVSSSVDAFGFPTAIPSPPAVNAAAMPLSSLKDMAAEALASTDQFGVMPKSDSEHLIRPLLDPSVAAPGMRLDGTVSGVSAVGASSAGIPQMQPLLGVAPLGPIPLGQDRVYQLRMLETAYKHLPQPSDSERVRPYLQRTPYPSQPYHHQHPPSLMDAFEFFQRLSIDTLFFVFYYMEGTKAQYMAAKALKKLSWRFHTKFMTWFQRLEEPKTITDDYEMGTYIYFDYEKWAQRKKDGFTFEYRYLEDRELP